MKDYSYVIEKAMNTTGIDYLYNIDAEYVIYEMPYYKEILSEYDRDLDDIVKYGNKWNRGEGTFSFKDDFAYEKYDPYSKKITAVSFSDKEYMEVLEYLFELNNVDMDDFLRYYYCEAI